MTSFVLVHGAWHGGWCWEDLAARLREAGHEVAAVDLPGRDDPSLAARTTLEDCVRVVRDAVDRASGPVVLVGHSLGGVTVTQAADALADRLAAVVYLTAFVPGDGQSLGDVVATGFEDSLAAAHQVVDVQRGVAWLAPDGVVATLFAHCDPEVARAAAARLVPEGLALQSTPVALRDGVLTNARRVYVEALDDRAIPIAKQRAMQRAAGIADVRSIDSDHSPQLSHPAETAALLREIAADHVPPM